MRCRIKLSSVWTLSAVALWLTAHGVRGGSRVALLLNNSPEFLIVLLASLRIGAIYVPINVREQTLELSHIPADCGAVLLLHDCELAHKLPLASELPLLENRFSVGGNFEVSRVYNIPVSSTGDLPLLNVMEEDTAVILYTSGTTVQPKGATLTHLNIIHFAMHFELCIDESERSLLGVPASHVMGLVAILFTMLRDAA
jgi:long-chain acyl-CoA synthetase